MVQESLFREHWRRFFDLVPQNAAVSTAIEGALFWNDQMGWSLGIIPWNSWRYPYQRAMLLALRKYCPQEEEQIYDIICNALAIAQGDYLSLPSEEDRRALISTVQNFCSERVAKNIVSQITQLKEKPPFLHLDFLEKILQFISKKRRLRKQVEFVTYHSIFLHFRIINNFFRKCEHFKRIDVSEKYKDIIALLTFEILWREPIQPPHFFTKHRICADKNTASPEIYNFWNWQYTYRNQNYKKIITPLEKFWMSNGIIFGNVEIATNKEYVSIYSRNIGSTNFFGMCFPEYDNAISRSIEEFGYYPTWPITGYTSDFILGRILSGEFKYWERETPPAKVSQAKQFTLCLRNPYLCSNENRLVNTMTDGEKQFYVCAPECLEAMKEKEQKTYHSVVNEERSRVRSEALHRMIGLWLWDYCQEHDVRPAEAMRVLREKHFPESNPSWNASLVPELQTNPDNQDWYNFRMRITADSALHDDLSDAERCIDAAKFLPRQRGTKKSDNNKKNKKKSKK